MSNDEFDFLLERAAHGVGEEKDRSLIAVALCAWPSEHLTGARQKIMLGPNASELVKGILGLSVAGTLSLHHEIKPEDITKGAFIAEGAAARVYKAKCKGHEKEVALKVFNTEHIAFSLDEFRTELTILTLLQHENLVPVSHFTIGNLPKISSVLVLALHILHKLQKEDKENYLSSLNTCRKEH